MKKFVFVASLLGLAKAIMLATGSPVNPNLLNLSDDTNADSKEANELLLKLNASTEVLKIIETSSITEANINAVCDRELDHIMLVDASGSMSEIWNGGSITKLLSQYVDKFKLDKVTGSRIAILDFWAEGRLPEHLPPSKTGWLDSEYNPAIHKIISPLSSAKATDATAIKKAMQNYKSPSGGWENLSDTLSLAKRDELPVHEARANTNPDAKIPLIITIFSDFVLVSSADRENYLELVKELRKHEDITFICVYPDEQQDMYSWEPIIKSLMDAACESKYQYKFTNFNEMTALLQNTACEINTTKSPTSSPAIPTTSSPATPTTSPTTTAGAVVPVKSDDFPWWILVFLLLPAALAASQARQKPEKTTAEEIDAGGRPPETINNAPLGGDKGGTAIGVFFGEVGRLGTGMHVKHATVEAKTELTDVESARGRTTDNQQKLASLKAAGYAGAHVSSVTANANKKSTSGSNSAGSQPKGNKDTVVDSGEAEWELTKVVDDLTVALKEVFDKIKEATKNCCPKCGQKSCRKKDHAHKKDPNGGAITPVASSVLANPGASAASPLASASPVAPAAASRTSNQQPVSAAQPPQSTAKKVQQQSTNNSQLKFSGTQQQPQQQQPAKPSTTSTKPKIGKLPPELLAKFNKPSGKTKT